jgi:hypothetical protein
MSDVIHIFAGVRKFNYGQKLNIGQKNIFHKSLNAGILFFFCLFVFLFMSPSPPTNFAPAFVHFLQFININFPLVIFFYFIPFGMKYIHSMYIFIYYVFFLFSFIIICCIILSSMIIINNIMSISICKYKMIRFIYFFFVFAFSLLIWKYTLFYARVPPFFVIFPVSCCYYYIYLQYCNVFFNVSSPLIFAIVMFWWVKSQYFNNKKKTSNIVIIFTVFSNFLLKNSIGKLASYDT